MYKVTLSMPVYNVAPYVERALLSALNQTFDSIEFLIVDDRGTDNSMDIVRKIVAEHPRGKDVRIIEHPHNIGLGATRNTAIVNAKGEYLFFMDSDDEITPDCIEVLYKAMMEDGPVDFVAGSYEHILLKGKKISYLYNCVKIKGENALANEVYKYQKRFCIGIWNKLYTLSFLHDHQLYCFPHHLNEDEIFTDKIIYETSCCKLLDHVTLLYYERPNSTMYKRAFSLSVRDIKEFEEIISFKRILLGKYIKSNLRGFFLSKTIRYTYGVLLKICLSTNISIEEKKIYSNKIVSILNDQINIIQLRPLLIKNIMYAIILKIPYFMQYRIINMHISMSRKK